MNCQYILENIASIPSLLSHDILLQTKVSSMALFTKKDLGLLLPDDVPGDPVSLRHTNTRYTDGTALCSLRLSLSRAHVLTPFRSGAVVCCGCLCIEKRPTCSSH